MSEGLAAAAERLHSAAELEALRGSLREGVDPRRRSVVICAGTGCRAAGAEEVMAAFHEEIGRRGLGDEVDVKWTGCRGFCERGPLAVLQPSDLFYQGVTVEDVSEIIQESILGDRVIHRLTEENAVTQGEIPFYRKQTRILLESNERIDPTSIEDYIAAGGYAALAKALFEMSPEEIVREIKKSRLRGRGGGGFPTGTKWETCRNAPGEARYVMCNADEGDPGAYMDRSLLEGNPHGILEGMIIGAYAIGARQGYVYVRNEYPLAVDSTRIAIARANECGLLGENILGSGFDFTVRIVRGGGAFVCGESTALMASLEGEVGRPRAKYIHTVKKGFRDSPSNLNNVETWANVPVILSRGADWYRSIGTPDSPGTKVFSLVGKIRNTGLVEVPMGITLREIIYDIGGGIPGGKKFKAVQTGGPSGGCIPETLIDLPVDFDELTRVGSMMGSGGMIVLDENTCMVDIARYFIEFLRNESCGKCVPCREGIRRMLGILTSICRGEGTDEGLALLEELCRNIKKTALCALGGTAPNPVLTTLRYFRQEYEAHIREKRCPAGVCKELIRFDIDPEKCEGCGLCAKRCPQQAVSGEKKEPHRVDQDACIKCGVCHEACKFDAVFIT
jgi:NADH-quinone oxidoreductase subunit F